tara:strand:- start:474 stop:593 length:120 start_codon:yes stop_codon:yes gene_type:complete
MRNLICVLPLAFILACGDKDEDTGSEDTSGQVDTSGQEE